MKDSEKELFGRIIFRSNSDFSRSGRRHFKLRKQIDPFLSTYPSQFKANTFLKAIVKNKHDLGYLLMAYQGQLPHVISRFLIAVLLDEIHLHGGDQPEWIKDYDILGIFDYLTSKRPGAFKKPFTDVEVYNFISEELLVDGYDEEGSTHGHTRGGDTVRSYIKRNK